MPARLSGPASGASDPARRSVESGPRAKTGGRAAGAAASRASDAPRSPRAGLDRSRGLSRPPSPEDPARHSACFSRCARQRLGVAPGASAGQSSDAPPRRLPDSATPDLLQRPPAARWGRRPGGLTRNAARGGTHRQPPPPAPPHRDHRTARRAIPEADFPVRPSALSAPVYRGQRPCAPPACPSPAIPPGRTRRRRRAARSGESEAWSPEKDVPVQLSAPRRAGLSRKAARVAAMTAARRLRPPTPPRCTIGRGRSAIPRGSFRTGSPARLSRRAPGPPPVCRPSAAAGQPRRAACSGESKGRSRKKVSDPALQSSPRPSPAGGADAGERRAPAANRRTIRPRRVRLRRA